MNSVCRACGAMMEGVRKVFKLKGEKKKENKLICFLNTVITN